MRKLQKIENLKIRARSLQPHRGEEQVNHEKQENLMQSVFFSPGISPFPDFLDLAENLGQLYSPNPSLFFMFLLFLINQSILFHLILFYLHAVMADNAIFIL